MTQQRRWLITGASSGFGAAFVRAALQAGDEVVAGVRRPDSMEDLVRQHPDRLTVVSLDVRDPAQCREAIAHAGRVDVLVNNAGYGIVGAVEESTEEEFRDALEVMFFGALRLTQLVLPQMRERRDGAIVQITSMGGLLAYPGNGAYCAAKGALELASEALAAEVKPLGIRVLIVEPGAFRTGFAGPSLRLSTPLPDYEQTVGVTRARLTQMHGTQAGDPDRAAAAVLQVLNQPDPPLRLALGEDAVSAIREKITTLLEELDQTEALSLATTF